MLTEQKGRCTCSPCVDMFWWIACFQTAQKNNPICRNIQLLNGLSLNTNKQKMTVQPDITVRTFGKSLAKLLIKIAHQLQVLPKQTSLSVFETPQRKIMVRDDILGSFCFPPACWNLQHPCMDGPFTARSCQTILMFPEWLKKSYGTLNWMALALTLWRYFWDTHQRHQAVMKIPLRAVPAYMQLLVRSRPRINDLHWLSWWNKNFFTKC